MPSLADRPNAARLGRRDILVDVWHSNRDQSHGGEQALEGGPQVPELEDEVRAH